MTASYDKTTFQFRDGYRAFARYYPAADKTPILYLHGIQSHGRWFENSAQHLAHAGHPVLLPDRRGSGRNIVARGDVKHHHRWLADLTELAQHLIDTTEKPRIHLIAVSWGGKLAAAFAQHAPHTLASLTLVAPGIYPAVDLPPAAKLSIALAAGTRSQRPFPIPLNDPALFTANPERQTFIGSDTHRLTAVTARFLYHSRLLDRHVRIVDQRFLCPVKLILAQHDQIIDNPRTLNLFRSWRAPKKQLTHYANAHHTLEFEPDPTPYFDRLLEWINETS